MSKKQNITIEDIRKFSKLYNSNLDNKKIEKEITSKGLESACLNKDIINENKTTFNVQLPESIRYDQKYNSQCWIYSGLNFIKYNIANNLKINLLDFKLSNNYLAFFDKLEKSNSIYEDIIKLKKVDFDYINNHEIVSVHEVGFWQLFVNLINKYGIVPYECMPDSVESLNSEKIYDVYSEKIKKDVFDLIQLKEKQVSINELKKVKKIFLQEDYIFLSKILGEPVQQFDYKYTDKNSKSVCFNNITPVEFKNKYLTLNLSDFILIGNIPKYNKTLNKIYLKDYWQVGFQFFNLSIEELKKFAIKQLKDNIPVCVGLYIYKYRDFTSRVLDTRLYKYEEMLDLKKLTKEEALNSLAISMHHFVNLIGVNIENNKPQRWKVEDSFGDKDKFNGCYIMNDNYFSEFVLSGVINKKYLSKNQLELLNNKVIKFKDSIF
ncbi:MAG: C1 family peptidase [Clostridia bacterium]|nr:C1 family peptidase [Clostridia bacterium]